MVLSAVQAAAKLWPEVFETPEAEARKEELVEKMRVVRPVVETGCVRKGPNKAGCMKGGQVAGQLRCLALWEAVLFPACHAASRHAGSCQMHGPVSPFKFQILPVGVLSPFLPWNRL